MNKNFISATEEYCTLEKHLEAPYFRKTFNLDFIPLNAQISICGLGFYRLYINGKDITKGALAPYISNPDHICYYDSYDIKSLLKEGENVIGIVLGNGFMDCVGGIVWDFDKAPWRGAPCVALEFIAEGREKSLAIEADTSFKVHSSPIVFDDLRFGEYYDANKEILDWNKVDFDDSNWDNAISVIGPKGILREGFAEPIKISKELEPIRILKQDDGYIYDFGENNSGVCSLKISARKNQRIELWHGEELKDGKFDNTSIIFERPDTQFYKEYAQKDVYIAKGEGLEEYTPTFTFHGFRYVLVKGINKAQATKELLTYKVMSSSLKTIGGFECSEETANTLFEMVKRSDISNFFYFPMDCPHREKNGWTGDASLSAAHTSLIYDAENSWREWLYNIKAAQKKEGIIPAIIPTHNCGYVDCNGPTWDSVLFNLPYEIYKKKGNKQVVFENAEAMINYLKYIITKRNQNGTVAIGLGDWLPVGKECHEYTVPVEITDSVMVMDMARKAEEMFRAIGLASEAEFANEIYKDFRKVIREQLIDKETMATKGESQTGQAVALYYGVFEEDEEEIAFKQLMKYIANNNYNFDCGFIGMHVLFHVLTRFGQGDLAYEMITKKDYPSYAFLIEQGETTMVESFQPTGKSCGSHNHHFLGDIGRWFIKCVAGLNIINSKTIEVNPCFIEKLNYAKAYHDFECGRVTVEWTRNSIGILLKVECPESIKYTIKLQKGYIMTDGIINKE